MGNIETKFDLPKNLTTFRVVGKMRVADFYDCLVTYYEGEVTLLILWDLTKADLSALRTSQIKEVARNISRISEVRRGGKTAFVYDKPFEYGMGRMFQAYSQMEEMSFETQAFKSIEQAKAWLGV